MRLGNVLYNIVDAINSRMFTYKKVTTYFDGTIMNDGKVDGYIYRKKGSEYFKRLSFGRPKAHEFGIVGDGTDKTALLNSILAMAHIHTLVFDEDDQKQITISGTVNGQSKLLVFNNGCSLVGTGTINNIYYECNNLKQCFSPTLTVSHFNEKVSICHFGGVADFNADLFITYTDNYPCWLKALNSFPVDKKAIIYFPQPKVGYANIHVGYYYAFSTNIGDVTKTVKIYGDGYQNSILLLNGTQLGIRLLSPLSSITNLGLTGEVGQVSAGIDSDSAHGLWVACNQGVVDSVMVKNFNGDGILLGGDTMVGTNANQCNIKFIHSYANGRAGIHTVGGDTNACHIEHIDCVGNARYNEWYEDFLGNNIPSGHNASASHTHNYNKTVVTHGGNVYWCIQDTNSVVPGTDENYWYPFPALSPLFSTTWTSGVQYLSGAAIRLDGSNSQGVITSHYLEPDQYAVIQNSTYLIIGGQSAVYGSVQGAIANRLGSITARQWQAYNFANNNIVEILAKSGTGLPVLLFDGPLGNITFGPLDTNLFGYLYASLGSTLGPSFGYSGSVYKSWARVDTDSPYIMGFHRGGLLLGNTSATSIYRRIVFGSAIPTTGTYGLGSIILPDEDAASDILYWRCTAASVGENGGTWETVSLPIPPALPVVVTTAMEANGTDTIFTYPHGITGGVATDSPVFVQARSEDAMGNFYVTIDNTNVYINYATAPIAGGGDNNLIFSIQIYQVTP